VLDRRSTGGDGRNASNGRFDVGQGGWTGVQPSATAGMQENTGFITHEFKMK